MTQKEIDSILQNQGIWNALVYDFSFEKNHFNIQTEIQNIEELSQKIKAIKEVMEIQKNSQKQSYIIRFTTINPKIEVLYIELIVYKFKSKWHILLHYLKEYEKCNINDTLDHLIFVLEDYLNKLKMKVKVDSNT